MIITRTPFRISFVGGGTDLSKFYLKHGGAVLSSSINKYLYLSGHEYFYENKMLIKYSQTEEVSSYNDIKHNIIREVFKEFSIKCIDFNSTADIPGGTGMGSSSTFTSGLIKLCCEYTQRNLSNSEIAEMACDIEINRLGEPIGKQDQFAASIGGLNLIEFNQNGSTKVTPLTLPLKQKSELESNLYLFYTGIKRSASEILKVQNDNLDKVNDTSEHMIEMKNMAYELFNELSIGNNDSMGYYLDLGWQKKRLLAKGISDKSIDDLYMQAIKYGATGGKLLGAGGGGFLLFYCPPQSKDSFLKNFTTLRHIPFKFEKSGTTTLFKN
jgi:D-glycero-alpha-D-manno-heptose-7-phosphate kinase